MQTGVGLDGSGNDTDPQCTLKRFEGDKLRLQQTRSMGKLGASDTRVIFRRLGKWYDSVFEWSTTAAVPSSTVTDAASSSATIASCASA